MSDDLAVRPRRARRVGAFVSFVLAGLAAASAGFGLLVVYTANSPSNRANNPWADIGVAFGWVLLIVMSLLALLLLAVGFLFRRR